MTPKEHIEAAWKDVHPPEGVYLETVNATDDRFTGFIAKKINGRRCALGLEFTGVYAKEATIEQTTTLLNYQISRLEQVAAQGEPK